MGSAGGVHAAIARRDETGVLHLLATLDLEHQIEASGSVKERKTASDGDQTRLPTRKSCRIKKRPSSAQHSKAQSMCFRQLGDSSGDER